MVPDQPHLKIPPSDHINPSATSTPPLNLPLLSGIYDFDICFGAALHANDIEAFATT